MHTYAYTANDENYAGEKFRGFLTNRESFPY